MELKTSKEIEIRFSDVDMMKVAWHGSYPLYLEDAREAFGAEYDLSYQGYIDHNYYAPIRDIEDNKLYCKARTVQVFMDMNYNLVLTNPDFFINWKRKWQQ